MKKNIIEVFKTDTGIGVKIDASKDDMIMGLATILDGVATALDMDVMKLAIISATTVKNLFDDKDKKEVKEITKNITFTDGD